MTLSRRKTVKYFLFIKPPEVKEIKKPEIKGLSEQDI